MLLNWLGKYTPKKYIKHWKRSCYRNLSTNIESLKKELIAK